MRSLCTTPQRDVADGDLPGEVRTVCKGQILFRQEDRVDHLFYLTSGRVQLYRCTHAGKRLNLVTVGAGTFFGPTSLVGALSPGATAEAIEDSQVRTIEVADVERLIRAQPWVALRIMEALSHRLALAEVRSEEMAYRGVSARVAAVLLRLNNGRSGATMVITHQELGEMVGALRETVTKILDAFEAAGLVALGRGRITIRDANALRARLDD